jgi:hypothetical protein
MTSNISIHEDDYCQIQFLPFENLEFVSNEMEEIIGFTHKNFSENGFEKIFERRNPNFPLLQKSISRLELENLIKKCNFEKIQNVNIGYGSSYKNSINYGFGTDECAILFECEKDIVKTIWLNFYWIAPEKQKENLKGLLMEIRELWNLILIDWNQCIVAELNEQSLNKYLNG